MEPILILKIYDYMLVCLVLKNLSYLEPETLNMVL